jgi:hypothetical protein
MEFNMTAEVRTTVDEKIISNMSKPEIVQEPIKDEIIADESPDIKEDKVEDNTYLDKEESPKADDKAATEKDEFGNEVVSKKTYTEDEVNEIMRQRFNRTKKEESVHESKPQQQENQSQEGDENWESQLEGFVENTVKKMTQKQQEKSREFHERQMNDEFQDKMIRGMGRYKDFNDVVGKMPISDPMLLATRQMKDPAAFIYAASKTQAKEIERIAQIPDPYYQAAEMGRLEERMRKVRMSATGSPKPVSQIKGDIENRGNVRGNVDDLIRKDQLKKFSRRY